MRQAKLGIVFLGVVVALAGAGVGYALWFQDLVIEGVIETGEFCVGIRDDGTGDPGDHFKADGTGGELYPQGEYPSPPRILDVLGGTLGTWDLNYLEGPFVDNSEGKNIGETESTNDGDIKCTHETIDYYHGITETILNAYPYYQTWIAITFANCGTVPAMINSGGWDVDDDPAFTNLMPWVMVDEIYLVKDYHELGWDNADSWYGNIPLADMEGFQYQLDPCDTITFIILFHFEEFADYDGDGSYDDDGPDGDSDPDLLPQLARMEFTYNIQWAQWNEVDGTPTPISQAAGIPGWYIPPT